MFETIEIDLRENEQSQHDPEHVVDAEKLPGSQVDKSRREI